MPEYWGSFHGEQCLERNYHGCYERGNMSQYLLDYLLNLIGGEDYPDACPVELEPPG